MKAIILAGGRGKRLAEISAQQNKCVFSVFGRPLIEYSLECASSLPQIQEIIIVVGYRAEDIINTYGTNYKTKRIRYVIQWEQRGVVDALVWAKEALEECDFMLLLGDEFMFNPRHSQMIEIFQTEELFAVCGIIPVEDRELVKRTYTIVQDSQNRIQRLVEKPANPFNNLMGTGNCIFKHEIFDYVDAVKTNSNRGEKELPDLIQCAIDDNQIVKTCQLCERYINLNSPREIRELESYFTHF